jgi:hypothetical protein
MPAEKRNLIQYQRIKRDRTSNVSDDQVQWDKELMDLLEGEDKAPVAKKEYRRSSAYR